MGTNKRWDAFWELVHLARDDRAKFEAKLYELDQQQLIELYRSYEAMVADLKGEDFLPYWGARSEDYIDGVAHDIVAQGEDYYLDVLEHPERLKHPPENVDLAFSVPGAVMQVYQKRFGHPVWSAPGEDERP